MGAVFCSPLVRLREIGELIISRLDTVEGRRSNVVPLLEMLQPTLEATSCVFVWKGAQGSLCTCTSAAVPHTLVMGLNLHRLKASLSSCLVSSRSQSIEVRELQINLQLLILPDHFESQLPYPLHPDTHFLSTEK